MAPAICTLWKTSWDKKPMVAPITASLMSRHSTSKVFISPKLVCGATLGNNSMLITMATPNLTVEGTERPPRKGASTIAPDMRARTRPKSTRNDPISPRNPRPTRTCCRVASTQRSSTHAGNGFEEGDGKLHRLGQRPWTENAYGHEHPGQFGNVAQSLIVNLRGGLKNTDHQANDHAGQHRASGK